jgi:predicted alpha-1,2-mannosidase
MRNPNKASLAWLLFASLLLSGSGTRPGARILFARGRSGIAAPAAVSAADADLTQFVNTYVGSAGADMGNTFPGAALRFGMIQWSPDSLRGFDRRHAGSYLYSDNAIRGFSLTHLSGPGCQIMGDVLITPVAGSINDSPAADPGRYAAKFSHSNEQASPGYYSVALDNGTKVQLAVTTRAGIGSFAFPASASSGLLFNVGRDGSGVESASIDIVGDRSITGSVSSGRFCGMKQNKYTVYFAAEFNRPFTRFGTWTGPSLDRGRRSLTGAQSGGFVEFDTTSSQVVQMKVALSYVSAEKARKNLDAEIPGWGLDAVREAGHEHWKHDLGLITVSGGTDDERRVFYTALYHALLHPNIFNDFDGQYIGFDRQIHLAQGINIYANFSGWDIYRCQVQLLAMLFPRESSDMVTSMVLAAQQGGGLPVWPVANSEACVMVGNPSSPIIASIYAFGARKFDAKGALAAMLKGASDPDAHEQYCPEWDNLSDYLLHGYVGPDTVRSDKLHSGPSQTLEFTTADFSIAQFAQAIGNTTTYKTFMKRAQFWKNIFDPRTGYIAPRKKDGSFIPVDPASGHYYVEGNAAQYSWMVPYNLRGLFDLMGGNAKVVERLNKFFTEVNATDTKPFAWIGNEPSFAIPWAYDFAGAPWGTQSVARRVELELFSARPDGEPGNDDLGAMSAWYVFAALGAYPAIPGVGGLALNSPLFPAATIQLGNGSRIEIEAGNAAAQNPYVLSLSVNGQQYGKTWLPYELLSRGATLRFKLGSLPNKDWGTKPEDAPPSFSEGSD